MSDPRESRTAVERCESCGMVPVSLEDGEIPRWEWLSEDGKRNLYVVDGFGEIDYNATEHELALEILRMRQRLAMFLPTERELREQSVPLPPGADLFGEPEPLSLRVLVADFSAWIGAVLLDNEAWRDRDYPKLEAHWDALVSLNERATAALARTTEANARYLCPCCGCVTADLSLLCASCGCGRVHHGEAGSSCDKCERCDLFTPDSTTEAR